MIQIINDTYTINLDTIYKTYINYTNKIESEDFQYFENTNNIDILNEISKDITTQNLI